MSVRKLKNLLLKKLCPNGVWRLTKNAELLLRRQTRRLPSNNVSEDETRYPTTPAGMRSFLDSFFARHYFQTQNSMIGYITSDDFLDILESGKLRILDIGCGPAVVSLAITDMVNSLITILKELSKWPRNKSIKINYVLNDTSGICLGVGQQILTDYFRMKEPCEMVVVLNQIFSIHKTFPENISQLKRIARNSGSYDIVACSYVVIPLKEIKGFQAVVNGLSSVEDLCSMGSKIMILQDKFNAGLMRRISKALNCPLYKEKLTQQIYSSKNDNETFTYSYYSCLRKPAKQIRITRSA